MLYILKVDDWNRWSKGLKDDEVKDFAVINLGKYFEYMGKKLCPIEGEEKNLTKVVKSLYIFLTISDEEEKYVEMIQSSSSENCICH